ncbi:MULTISPECIES: hypothetical protein [Nocardia]
MSPPPPAALIASTALSPSTLVTGESPLMMPIAPADSGYASFSSHFRNPK